MVRNVKNKFQEVGRYCTAQHPFKTVTLVPPPAAPRVRALTPLPPLAPALVALADRFPPLPGIPRPAGLAEDLLLLYAVQCSVEQLFLPRSVK